MRQPAALAVLDGGKTILAANRRSGSISVIDAGSRRVVAEHEIGHGLSDLAVLPDGQHLLALDQAGHDLILLSFQDSSIQILERRRISPNPVRLIVSADGSSWVAASLWSRRLTFGALAPHEPEDKHPGLSIAGSLELPFCPREMAVFPGGAKLVAADAFGGRIAVVQPPAPGDRFGPIAARAQHPRAGLLPRRPGAADCAPGARPPGASDLR